MADWRKLGLCYDCDEPYVHGHKCSCLFYLEVSDYDKVDLLLPKEDQKLVNQTPMISLHAIIGIPHEQTVKLHVAIGNHKLTGLVAFGSTHNFIQKHVARRIGLHYQETRGANALVRSVSQLIVTPSTLTAMIWYWASPSFAPLDQSYGISRISAWLSGGKGAGYCGKDRDQNIGTFHPPDASTPYVSMNSPC
jgi:hypothetical protein